MCARLYSVDRTAGFSRKSTTRETSIMEFKVGKFTFAIPEGHPEAGKKIEKAFDYRQCENDAEAQEVMTEKSWKLFDLVNDNLKQNARSTAYQAATLPYRASDVPAEDIKERMIRDFIRLGVSEEAARAQVESLLAAKV